MSSMDDSGFFIIMLVQNIVLSPLSNCLIFFILSILNLIYLMEQDLHIYFFVLICFELYLKHDVKNNLF